MSDFMAWLCFIDSQKLCMPLMSIRRIALNTSSATDKLRITLEKWYDFINKSHHKDADCHMYIGQGYHCYDNSGNKRMIYSWYWWFPGYLVNDYNGPFVSRAKAELDLMNTLTQVLEDRKHVQP